MGVCDHAEFLRQVSDAAVRRLPQDAILVAVERSVSICLSVWASVIVLNACARCQMWQSESSLKMQALWLHQHCVYLSDCTGICDHTGFLRQVSDVAVRRLPQDASLVAVERSVADAIRRACKDFNQRHPDVIVIAHEMDPRYNHIASCWHDW